MRKLLQLLVAEDIPLISLGLVDMQLDEESI